VTRPGLAALASALSVELMVSLLQHPNGYFYFYILGGVSGGEIQKRKGRFRVVEIDPSCCWLNG
jgi:hypothetical protein